jgi:hypothetical protein
VLASLQTMVVELKVQLTAALKAAGYEVADFGAQVSWVERNSA